MWGARLPSDAERQAFVAKLAQFRGRLSVRERQMLDELVAAGRQAHDQGDMQVYWLGDSSGTTDTASDLWAPYSTTATYTGVTEGFRAAW
jgi:hypothetical protein